MKAMSIGHFNGKINNTHVLCHVTVGKGSPETTFVISDPKSAIHYITFMGLQ